MLEDFFAWGPCRTTITLPRHLHLLITRHRVSQSTAPDRGLIDDIRPLRRTPTRQRRGQPHDARRSRAWLTWDSSQLPRSLKNLRQNCLRLIVNVDGSLGRVAVSLNIRHDRMGQSTVGRGIALDIGQQHSQGVACRPCRFLVPVERSAMQRSITSSWDRCSQSRTNCSILRASELSIRSAANSRPGMPSWYIQYGQL